MLSFHPRLRRPINDRSSAHHCRPAAGPRAGRNRDRPAWPLSHGRDPARGALRHRGRVLALGSVQFAVQLFRDEYQVPLLPPALAATIATTFELTCPVLLALGLATRLGTLPLLGMTMVIQLFVYPQSWPEHLTWAALLLLILTRGPGPISLDHLIGRYLLGRKD
jgi:putative oxidoreductase